MSAGGLGFPAGAFEAGLKPFDRVVEILKGVDSGASPKEIARAINSSGVYFVQRKES